ncbi:unnamed protein product [Lathyrus sativus]|nr:unnamed protein product [Lathyrus sativus]
MRFQFRTCNFCITHQKLKRSHRVLAHHLVWLSSLTFPGFLRNFHSDEHVVAGKLQKKPVLDWKILVR